MKRKLFKSIWLVALLNLIEAPALHSQQHLGIAAGVGFPEAFHLGLRYHWDQTHAGVYYGLAEDWRSIGASLGYHIFGSSSQTPIKPGYLKAGIFHTRIDDFMFWNELKYSSLELRGGYTLNFTNWAGFEVDTGPTVLFHLEADNIKSNGIAIGFGFGGRFFLRL